MSPALSWPIVAAPLVVVLAAWLLEAGVQPRPAAPWRRSAGAARVHAGTWLLVYAAMLLWVRRPVFAAVLAAGLALLGVLVNNAKFRSLREAFICQDFEYFSDMLRHPRLYLPFFGIGRAVAGVLLFVAAMAVGGWAEAPLPGETAWTAALLQLMAGVVLAAWGARGLPEPDFDPNADLRRMGLAASWWAYGRAESHPPAAGWPVSPFSLPHEGPSQADAPDIVAVQSESFFDARRLDAGIRADLLPEFDRLRAEAVAAGRLAVPAWGANTVRTEFAFLSGLAESGLGVHRFNPYRKLGRQGIATLAALLRARGYRTVCVHPYPGSFYRRDDNLPRLGFDEFLDIRAFAGTDDPGNAGPYVSDLAVAERVRQCLAGRVGGKPLFVYVITMENHGPLHLEAVAPHEETQWLTAAAPAGCRDLVAYLRHLRHADAMIGRLRQVLAEGARPGVLAFYGDHVPIMPAVYAALGEPGADTDYVVWRTGVPAAWGTPQVPQMGARLPVDALGAVVLQAAGVAPGPAPDVRAPDVPVSAGAPVPAPVVRYPMPGDGRHCTPAFLPLAASGRSFVFGRGAARTALLDGAMDRGRLIAATLAGEPAGFLSFGTHERGPYLLAYRDFRRVFGAVGGAGRWLLHCCLARREKRHAFYVYSVRVAEAARRRGVGAALLAEAERQARLLGAPAMTAEVFAHNTRSQAFFAAHGFRQVGRTGLPIIGRWMPATSVLRLRRELTPIPAGKPRAGV